MTTTYVTANTRSTSATVAAGNTLNVLGTASLNSASVLGVDDIYGTAQQTVVQSGGVEFVFMGGVSTGATLLAGGRQVLAVGSPPVLAATVQAGGAAVQTVTFPYNDATFALGLSVAAAISAANPSLTTTVPGGTTTYLPAGITGVVDNQPSATTVVASGPASVIAGAGGLTFFAAAGTANTVAIAGGSNTVGTGSGSTYQIDVSGNSEVYASGSGTVAGGIGATTIVSGSGANNLSAGGTADVIALASGASTVSESGSGALIFASSGNAIISDVGTSNTVVGSTGADTIFAGNNEVLFLGSGASEIIGSAAPSTFDTVVGTSSNAIGNATMFGGIADLIFANSTKLTYVMEAGGSATVNGGAGTDTLFTASGASLTYFASNPGADLITGAGISTINALSATAAVTFIAGSGQSVLIGGSGADTFFAGGGTATMTGGSSKDVFVFVKGTTGGPGSTDLIYNFGSGDLIDLVGYGANEVSNAIASEQVVSNNATLTLADSTRIIFNGTPSLSSGNVNGFSMPSSGGTVVRPALVPASIVADDDLTVPQIDSPTQAPDDPQVSTGHAGTVAGGNASNTQIASGGEQDVQNGGTATNATILAGGLQLVSVGGVATGTTIAGGRMNILTGGSASGGIAFTGTGGELDIQNPGTSTPLISGYVSSDTIALGGIAGQPAPTYSSDQNNNTTITYANGTAITLQGRFANGAVTIQNDTNVPCFAAGTRIAIPGGAIPVEDLRPGMRVLSAFGGDVPVRWIGRRDIDCTATAWRESVWPICIRAGAFGPGLPARDLRLSPDHAIYADGVLIPVRCLLNGDSVRQQHVDAVSYFHVELPAHDVILAEGLPAESYLDTGNRAGFANTDSASRPPGQSWDVWTAEGCADLVLAGPRLDRVRRRLADAVTPAA